MTRWASTRDSVGGTILCMVGSVDGAIVAALGAGIATILTVVFAFILRWSKTQSKRNSDRPSSRRKGKSGSSSAVATPGSPMMSAHPVPQNTSFSGMVGAANAVGAMNQQRHMMEFDSSQMRAMQDISTVNWSEIERQVKDLAEQQRMRRTVTIDELNKALSESEVRTGLRFDKVEAKVDRLDRKLEHHIQENGSTPPAAGRYRKFSTRSR